MKDQIINVAKLPAARTIIKGEPPVVDRIKMLKKGEALLVPTPDLGKFRGAAAIINRWVGEKIFQVRANVNETQSAIIRN